MHEITPTDIEHNVDEIATQGFSIATDVIAPEFLSEIREELDRLQRVRPGGDLPAQPFTGFYTRRWFDVLNDGEVWQRVATHPLIMAVMPKVLGEGFLLSTMGSAIIGHGEEAQPFHVDDGVYAFPRPHPNLVCNTMWAIDDFTEENGATRVVPGSNNFDRDPEFQAHYESIPLEMPAGSIAFVLGNCYHGAGENTSGTDRAGLTINYCNGSMRQQENLMLSIHPARLMDFSRELQDILGFKLCGAAGHMFATDPRSEMERHYGNLDQQDPYLDVRDEFHSQRVGGNRIGSMDE